MTGFAADVLTLYPEMFPGPLGISLAGEGLRKGLWALDTHQIRDHGIGRHRNVDEKKRAAAASPHHFCHPLFGNDVVWSTGGGDQDVDLR